jgi:plasmid replication initiation protein
MKNRNIVKQGYQLINARYKLNTNEIKFIMLVIAQIDIDDIEFKSYDVKVSELDKRLSSNIGYTRLKNFTKDIMSKPFSIDTDFGFQTFNWFSGITYYERTGLFSVRISNDLKPYLLELKSRFVKFNLQYILPLSSSYSIRLYQLFKEYEKLTRRTFTVIELQELLQVPKSLKIYDNFKRKVIKVAEKELIENCDIFFEYEEIKQGRKVTELLFRIKPNKQILQKQSSLFSSDPNIYDDLIGKHMKSTDGIKTIMLVTPFSDFIQVTFEDGTSTNQFKSIEVLKLALLPN